MPGSGLVQAVAVPAGASLASFVCRPRRVPEGMVLSALGVLALIVVLRRPAGLGELERLRRPI